MAPFRVLLALALLCLPAASLADDLEDFFPGLISEIQANFAPVVVIEGGSNPGEFPLDVGQFVSGLFDGRDGVANLSEEIGSQAQRNPISSTIAAFTFEFDPGLNVFTRTTEGLGPLLSERAQTTGKGKLNVAFSYAYVDFDEFEGEDLDELEVSFGDTVPFVIQASGVNGAQQGSFLDGTGVIVFQNDDFNFGPNQVLTFFDEGFLTTGDPNGTITNDPVFDEATIAGFHDSPFISGFVDVPAVRSELDAEIRAQVFALFFTYGVTDRIDLGLIVPFLDIAMEGQVTTFGLLDDTGAMLPPQSTKHRKATDFGLGDITARVKMNLYESKWIDAGVRGDVILPTGDEEDFMGYGDPAFQLTAIFSKSTKWISPHANAGILARINEKYGHAARWSAGVDLNLHERVSVGVDAVGEHQLYHDGFGDNVIGISPGLKFNPWERLVITATALVRLNDEGLRADVIPSGTIEYTFD